jgi:guanylate kinase
MAFMLGVLMKYCKKEFRYCGLSGYGGILKSVPWAWAMSTEVCHKEYHLDGRLSLKPSVSAFSVLFRFSIYSVDIPGPVSSMVKYSINLLYNNQISCYNLPKLIIYMATATKEVSSYFEPTLTTERWDEIWRENTLLSPETLSEIFPSYGQFLPIPDHPLIWSKTGMITPLDPPVIVGLFGPTSAGKDTLIDGLSIPHDRIVTTTSRPQRKNQKDKDGDKYYFLTPQEFQDEVGRDAFLEYMDQPSGLYGTTRKEVEDKIQKTKAKNIPLLLWRANVEGHRTFAPKVLEAYGMTVPGVFLIPRMPVQEYYEHIQRKRGEGEALKRWYTALAEIEHAPEFVDYLLVNLFNEDGGKQEAVNACDYLLSRLCSSC